jgi:hypothetical protein
VTTGHRDEFARAVRTLMNEADPDVTACSFLRETA